MTDGNERSRGAYRAAQPARRGPVRTQSWMSGTRNRDVARPPTPPILESGRLIAEPVTPLSYLTCRFAAGSWHLSASEISASTGILPSPRFE